MNFVKTKGGGAINVAAIHRIARGCEDDSNTTTLHGADDRVLGVVNLHTYDLLERLNAPANMPAAPGTFALSVRSVDAGVPTFARLAIIAWRFDERGPTPVLALEGIFTDVREDRANYIAIEFPDGHVESLDFALLGTWRDRAAWERSVSVLVKADAVHRAAQDAARDARVLQ